MAEVRIAERFARTTVAPYYRGVQVNWPKPNRRFGWVDGVALAGLLGLLVARYVPVARLPFWGCGFRELTGLPCPGCGLTRVAERMSHFNFLGALEANPLGAGVAFLFMVAIAVSVLHLVFRVPVPTIELSEQGWRRLRYGAIGLFCANYAFMLGRAVLDGP